MSSGWQTKKLGELFAIGSSRRVYESDWRESGVPFYRTREIISRINNEPINDPLFIDQELFHKYANSYGAPKKGDILVTGVGTIGKAWLVDTDDNFYFKDGNVIWLEDRGLCNPKFIYYLFKNDKFQQTIKDNASVGTVGTFTIIDAKNTKALMPQKEEQDAIVKVLDEATQKEDTLSGEIKRVEDLKKGLMQQIFSGKLRFKDGNGNDFPVWRNKKLGEIAQIGTGSRNTQDKIDDGKYSFYIRSQKIEKIDTYSYVCYLYGTD